MAQIRAIGAATGILLHTQQVSNAEACCLTLHVTYAHIANVAAAYAGGLLANMGNGKHIVAGYCLPSTPFATDGVPESCCNVLPL